MLHDQPINEKDYKKLKEFVTNIFYNRKKDFKKQAKKLSDELFELPWGQISLLAEALHIIFEKFNKLEEK